ncbi:hypothetical protein OSTOST_09925 [Ostertagia ostertagi]
MKTKIAVAKGDGIGPEIMDAVLHIMNAAGTDIEINEIEMGLPFYEQGYSSGMTNKAKTIIEETGILFKGPMETPKGKGNETYTVSVAVGVTDYTKDMKTFMKKIHAVTDGAFVLSWPTNGLRMALRRYRYTTPVYHYNEADIRRLHENLSLQSLEIVPMQGGHMSIARK